MASMPAPSPPWRSPAAVETPRRCPPAAVPAASSGRVLARSGLGAAGSGACGAAPRGRGGDPPPARETNWEREVLEALSW